MSMDSNLIIKKISLEKEKIKSFKEYPFNIEVVKNFNELIFESPVTFFVGENGIGKSTFIEAIAVALGLPAEGETEKKKLDFDILEKILCEEKGNQHEQISFNKEKITSALPQDLLKRDKRYIEQYIVEAIKVYNQKVKKNLPDFDN